MAFRYVVVNKATNKVVGMIKAEVKGRVPHSDDELLILHDTADESWTYNPETKQLTQYG